MASKRMSVEDILSEQSNSGLRATVEAIEGKDTSSRLRHGLSQVDVCAIWR